MVSSEVNTYRCYAHGLGLVCVRMSDLHVRVAGMGGI